MPKVFSAAKAIIVNNNKFLILKYQDKNITIWDLPGGKIEYGETPHETLKREVKEETSLEIDIIKSIDVWWFFHHATRNQVICHTYLCKAADNKIDLTKNPSPEEHHDYRWVTTNEFLESPDYNNIDLSLKELIKNNKTIFVNS